MNEDLTRDELNRLIATEIMGFTIRTIPAEYNESGTIKPNSPLWEEIVKSAIQDMVVLRQTSEYYKGVTYKANYKGWELSYSISHSDSYRAREILIIEGDSAQWLEPYELEIRPAGIPNYIMSSQTMILWEEFTAKNKNFSMILDSSIQNTCTCNIMYMTSPVISCSEKTPSEAMCKAIYKAHKWLQINEN